ncbi:MAG: hypothetical protein ACTSUC_09680 [Promethearchaeota archaeon]
MNKEKTLNELREKLADLEHSQWSHLEKYREKKLNTSVDFSGQLANWRRWRRLREKSYEDLTEKEKEIYREWADKVLKIVMEKIKNV